MSEDRQENRAQLCRIQEMEQILDRACEVMLKLESALSEFEAEKEKLKRLLSYYESGEWQRDYDDDAAGKLPASLKRGVLSQDAVYDLICDYQQLLETMRRLSRDADGDR